MGCLSLSYFCALKMQKMIDRTKQPTIKEITDLKLPEIKTNYLSNGIPVYSIDMGTQEVVKLEIIFKAGRPFENKRLVARATNSLLKEGSKHYSSAVLAEEFDFFGSTLSTPFNLDTSNVLVYSLNKHFDKIMPMVGDLLQYPAFPQQELDAFVRRSKHRLRVDLTKNDVLAYRKITELIFGEHHPYGYNSFEDTYEALRRDDLTAHFERLYCSNNCQVFISGRPHEGQLELLEKHLAHLKPGTFEARSFVPSDQKPEDTRIPLPDSVQTAVRIGRRLFDRKHEDYYGMYVLNTILGGYFSSRLMTNIREDKGYTYNIYSMLDAMLLDGYFYIGTEVGNEFVEDTKKEIYQEIELLQNELVDEEEMEMVRNYLIGNFLTMLDGPFNVAETAKTILTEDLPANFFESLVETVRSIEAEEIQRLAKKYLRREDLWEVVVGGE